MQVLGEFLFTNYKEPSFVHSTAKLYETVVMMETESVWEAAGLGAGVHHSMQSGRGEPLERGERGKRH